MPQPRRGDMSAHESDAAPAELGILLSNVWAINLAHLWCSRIVGTCLFTKSFCSPSNFKSTFDYYAVSRATAKIDLRSALISRGERNCEGLFRLEWRKEFDQSYAGELRVLTPFNQRCKDFVEDYNPGYEGHAGKMPRQTWVISADYADSFKGHPRNVSSASDQVTERSAWCRTPLGKAKPNRWQYVANTLSTSPAEEPNCDRSYRCFADCLLAWLATSTRMRRSASCDSDQPKYS